jgi:hypothetical protein
MADCFPASSFSRWYSATCSKTGSLALTSNHGRNQFKHKRSSWIICHWATFCNVIVHNVHIVVYLVNAWTVKPANGNCC